MRSIGKHIRDLRQKRGWSLEELGKRSGLSAGFLSQLERGHLSLSISSLKAIADAFNEPMHHFFPLPTNLSNIVRAEEARWLRIESTNVRYRLLSGPWSGKILEPLIVELPPCYQGPPPFAHEGEEFGYVLSGTLHLMIQDEVYKLKGGDSVHFSSRVPHTWENPGEEPMKAIWVVTPPIISQGGGGHEP